ncbi:MAG: hypothetical protein DME25_15375, partial [Verrucomicrobia bacterium]
STTYTNTGLAPSTTYYYVVRATNSAGASSNSVQANATTQSGAPTPPAITAQPQSLTVTAGQNATFSVTATGTVPLSYQWRFGGTNIPSATASAYTRANAQTNDAGNYSVVVTNQAGSATSTDATLTVTLPGTNTDIILDNTNAEVTFVGAWQTGTSAAGHYGDDYRFASSTGSGLSNATYRPYIAVAGNYDVYMWYPQGGNRATNAPWLISYNGGSTNVLVNQQINGGAWLLIASALPFAPGTNGFVRLANNAGPSVVIADAVRFSYSATQLTPPAITVQPQSQSVSVGASVNFSVTASGSVPLSYQWRFNGTNIAGATTNSFTRTNAQPVHAGTYSVEVTNGAGSTLSSNAVLTVIVPSPMEFDAILLAPDGCLHLQASGDLGSYTIDVTTDLLNWVQSTNLAVTNSPFEFLDCDTTAPRRFYRMRLSQ